MERDARWQKIQELYHAALERGAAGRAAFLQDACGDDVSLRREVESLLAQGDDDEFLATSALEVAAHDVTISGGGLIGRQVGPYQITALLGAGGMGQVYRARDSRLGRDVAVKVSAARFSERFEREARAVAALNHPNTCHLYDVGPNYLVMELIDGPTLSEKIEKGPIPLDEALAIAQQIADALEAAHTKGITHRDLKPSNIKIAADGTVKVLDFGLAKTAVDSTSPKDNSPRLSITESGILLGTAAYMSPEQAKGEPVDKRADIWAFGVVLYEMLTGERLYEAETLSETLAAVLKEEPDLGRVPSRVRPLLRSCLQKDPNRRLRDIADWKVVLAVEQEVRDFVPLRRGRRRWLWPAIAGAIASVALGGWAMERFQRDADGEPVRRLQITPPMGGTFVNSGGVNLGGMSLSPDGSMAAYVAAVRGQTALWVQPLDGTPRIVAGTDGASYPFWSPDSKSLAFFAKGRLQRVDAAGGAPFVIAEAASGRGGAWLDDDRIVVGNAFGPLSIVSASESGGTTTRLTELDTARGETSHLFPQVLPGGRLLYLALRQSSENGDVYATSPAEPQKRVRLLTTAVNAVYGAGHLLWWTNGSVVAQEFDPATLRLGRKTGVVAEQVTLHTPGPKMNVAVSNNGLLLYDASGMHRQLQWFDRDGKMLRAGELSDVGNFRISPSGRVSAIVGGSLGSAVWVVEENGMSSRVTSDSATYLSPVWSPDGRNLVVSVATPVPNLFSMPSDGTRPRTQLTQSPNVQFATDWSRDGRFIVYYENAPATERDLWILPLTPEGELIAGAAAREYLRTPANESWAKFSPEQSPRWLAYQSDVTGPYEVYVQAFPERRGQFRISADGGFYPQWSPEGRQLYFQSSNNRLTVASLKLGSDSVEVLERRELFALPQGDAGRNAPTFEVLPNGKGFVVRSEVQRTAAFTLVTNWPALLKGD